MMSRRAPSVKLKIAVLIKRFLRTGGAEKYALEVVRRLAVEHEVHVFAHEWSFDGPESITFHKIPRLCRKPAWLNQLFFSHRCQDATAKGFDIVHSFEKVAMFDVMTVQSPCFKSADLANQGYWTQLVDKVRMLLSPRKCAWRWLEAKQFADDGVRVIVAVSDYIKKNVQACYPLSDHRFHLAYTGVEVPTNIRTSDSHEVDELRVQHGVGSGNLVVLFVGTEFKRKGLDALLQGVALLPRGRVKLLIAGGGGGRLDYYKGLAGRMGLTGDVRFLGLVQQIEQFYPLADVYVLPTLADPCPLAPLEAMAAGVATVMSASAYNGSAELIREGEAVLLSDPRNPQEIVDTLTRLMDRQVRDTLARNGCQAARRWSWDQAAAETLAAYRDVMQRKALVGSLKLEAQGAA
ncbi:MAG: glycosyltransferase family 4 protein [Nitrospira sp.]